MRDAQWECPQLPETSIHTLKSAPPLPQSQLELSVFPHFPFPVSRFQPLSPSQPMIIIQKKAIIRNPCSAAEHRSFALIAYAIDGVESGLHQLADSVEGQEKGRLGIRVVDGPRSPEGARADPMQTRRVVGFGGLPPNGTAKYAFRVLIGHRCMHVPGLSSRFACSGAVVSGQTVFQPMGQPAFRSPAQQQAKDRSPNAPASAGQWPLRVPTATFHGMELSPCPTALVRALRSVGLSRRACRLSLLSGSGLREAQGQERSALWPGPPSQLVDKSRPD